MKAVLFSGNGKLALADVPRPELRDRLVPKKYREEPLALAAEEQVLLKVEAASICGSDLHILEGGHPSAPPVVLGHEYVGRVVEVGGAVTHVREGDRVVVDPNIKCGVCAFCRGGRPNLCRDFTTLGIFLDGGLAEYNLAPGKQLCVVSESVPLERAMFYEPLSCVVHAMNRVRPAVGERALIFGGGPIGCLFALVCRLAGVDQIVVVEPSAYRCSYARTAGATTVLEPGQEQDYAAAHAPDGFELVIDAAGPPSVVPAAMAVAASGARILLFGQQTQGARAEIVPQLANEKELTMLGSYAAGNVMCETVRLLEHPGLEVEKLISHRLPLERALEGFRLMAEGQSLKVMVCP
jgi:(R,R)-butanediol dehydrogenase/meso-butanediol dehydrogenase/diacetyl reductase